MRDNSARDIKCKAYVDGVPHQVRGLAWSKRGGIRYVSIVGTIEEIDCTTDGRSLFLVWLTPEHDKDGTELYEGDILQRAEGYAPLFIEWWNEASEYRLSFKDNNELDKTQSLMFARRMKRIGNRFALGAEELLRYPKEESE